MNDVRFRLQFFLIALITVLLLGTYSFMAVEHLSFEDALYYNIVTIATVGYGDIHPVTPAGKMLAILLIITGVGTFLGLIANVSELMLNKREKQMRLQKLNVAIGLFFSELGKHLLSHFSQFDMQLEQIMEGLIIANSWSNKDFALAESRLSSFKYLVDISRMNLESLRTFFEEQHTLLLRIMENPNLSEHENFTDMLMAVFHLREELHARASLTNLPAKDLEHLAFDITRAYALIVQQWLHYMKHLKEDYPYLFSLAVRTNPFDQNASPTVK
ncbi:MAG: potassium channel family protein [Pseudomonadota bacterium]